MSSVTSYAERMAAVERIVRKIEGTDDVEEALKLHDEAAKHLDHCQTILESAKGKLEVVETMAPTDK